MAIDNDAAVRVSKILSNPTRYPAPTNELSFTWNPNAQMNVSGGGGAVSTTDSGHIQGHFDAVSTSHNTTFIEVGIRYEGATELT